MDNGHNPMKHRIIQCRKALIVALALGGACASVPPTPAIPRTGTEVAASFDVAWQAAVQLFSDSNWMMYQIEKPSGYIRAQPFLVKVSYDQKYNKGFLEKGHPLADCGKAATGEYRMPQAVIYSVTVHSDGTRSTVKASARFLTDILKLEELSCTSRGRWEGAIEQEIVRRVGR